MYLVSEVSTPCLLSSRGKPSFAGSPTVGGEAGGGEGPIRLRRFRCETVPSAWRRCRRDNGAARIGGGMHAAAAATTAAAAAAPLLSSSRAGVRGGARASNAPYDEIATTAAALARNAQRAAHRRASAATVRRLDDDGRGRYATTPKQTSARTRQRLSNRPRGLSCPGSPALLRPPASYRDHSSHFHVPKSRSRRPSPPGERRNVRISASPDVDSVAAAAGAGKPDDTLLAGRAL